MLKLKRVYEEKLSEDGFRILVDRLWPRGVTKHSAAVDEWMREISPSNELRNWYSHEPEKWAEFKKRYKGELSEPEKRTFLQRIREKANKGAVTLVYAAKDTEHNNAVVLKEVLNEIRI